MTRGEAYWRDLGLRALAAGFEWQRGVMRDDGWVCVGHDHTCPDQKAFIGPDACGCPGPSWAWAEHLEETKCWPDFRDPGSMGSLLSLVRATWGDPGISCACEYVGGMRYMWTVCRGHHHGRKFVESVEQHTYASEAEALVAALEAACG